MHIFSHKSFINLDRAVNNRNMNFKAYNYRINNNN